MIKTIFVALLFSLFFVPLRTQAQISLDSLIENIYSNYNIGKLNSVQKRNGDYYITTTNKSTKYKVWDNKTNTFLKLDLRPSHNSKRLKQNVLKTKNQWEHLYFIYDIYENFGYQGYYNDEIKQRQAKDFKSSCALAICYSQKAENKFKVVNYGVKSEQFNFDDKPIMSKSQESSVRLLIDKAILHANKALKFAKSDSEKSQINRFMGSFKVKMFSFFETYAKRVDINEWLTEELFDAETIQYAKNKLIGIKSGDIVFSNKDYGQLLYVQHHFNIATGAHIIPIHLLVSKTSFVNIMSKIGIKKAPVWLSQFDQLKPVYSTSNPKSELPLLEAFKSSYSSIKEKSKEGYYFTYKKSKILIPATSWNPIQPPELIQYFIIENLKKGDIYWAYRNQLGIKNNLVADGLLLKLILRDENTAKTTAISSYNKIINELEYEQQNLAPYLKNRYTSLCSVTAKALAKEGELKKAQDLFKYKKKNFKLDDEVNWSTTASDLELALSLNLPKLALTELANVCKNIEPGVYTYSRNDDKERLEIWNISSFAKKYDCPELSDTMHKAHIYTKNTVKINKLENGKSQLTTLTGQPIVKMDYDSIRFIYSNYCIVQNENEWSIIDISGATVTKEIYQSIVKMGKFFLVQTKDGFGLISGQFKVLLPAKYSDLKRSKMNHYSPNESSYFIVKNDNKFGVIEIKNEVVKEALACEYSSIKEITIDYSEYLECAKEGESFILSSNGERFSNTNEIVEAMEEEPMEEEPVIYDFIDKEDFKTKKKDDEAANVGTHIIKENGLSGVVYTRRNNRYNQSENFLTDSIPAIYDSIIKDDGLYDWFFVKKGALWGAVNVKNETLIPFKYKEIGTRNVKNNYEDNRPISYIAVKDDSWGIFACKGTSQMAWSTLGKEVSKLEYDSTSYNGKMGYLIWKNGKVGVFSFLHPNKIIPPKYNKFKSVNTNFIQPVYTFIDENNKVIRVNCEGELTE